MEFGVLELGLKNKQIANISCFLKIQVEAFRINWNRNCEQSALDFSVSVVKDYIVLFNQWIYIFQKVLSIVNATLKQNVSSSDKNFGVKLAKVSLQTCNKLLSTLAKEPESDELKVEKNVFVTELSKIIEKIRAVVKAEKQYAVITSKSRKKFDDQYNQWQNLTVKDIVLNAIKESCLPLALYHLKSTDRVSGWIEIVQVIFNEATAAFDKNNFARASELLTQIGLPVSDTVYDVFSNAFSASLRSFLYPKLEKPQNILFREKQLLELLNIFESIFKDFDLTFNANLLKKLDNYRIQNILLIPIRENKDEELQEKASKFLSPKIVWQCLVANHETDLLLKWVKMANQNLNTSHFPFYWNINGEMLNYVYNNCDDEFLKEIIFNQAAAKGYFCEEELKFINVTIKRLLRCGSEEASAIILDSPCHPLKSVKSYSFSDFQQKVIDNALQNNLYQFLYWFLNRENSKHLLKTSNINSSVKDLLQTYITWNEDPYDCSSIFAAILMTAKHVYSLQTPINIQKLLDRGLSQLAVLALQYSHTGLLGAIDANPEQLTYANRNSFSTSLKDNYPLLYQALMNILHSSESDVFFTQDSPTIYSLLKNTTNFDISKLFCWQSTNHLRNNEGTCAFTEVPSFSDSKLAALYGFKANLTYLYYLNKGRPLEAYCRFLSEKGLCSKNIESARKKASLLAFYNCTERSITAACVIFVELLKNESSSLRLHLNAASLIMSYSAHFVAFEPKNQMQELGNLLKKARYHDNKRAASKIIQLIVAAFNRKYGSDDKPTIEECFEYKVAIELSKFYRLEAPTEFLLKCAQADDWLLFSVFAQMYDFPSNEIFKLLSTARSDGFNNKCIAEHLSKAFQSSHLLHSSTGKERDILEVKSRKPSKDTSAMYYRNTLFQRIGVKRKIENPNSLSPNTRQRALEDDRSSTHSDYDNIETLSIVSGSVYSEYFEGITFDLQNPPKDLFNLLLTCQKCNPIDPWKPLLASTITLNNPIPALIAASMQNDFDVNNMFDCFCCWLFASCDYPSKPLTNFSDACVTWSQNDFLAFIKNALIVPENYNIFKTGLHLFHLLENPLTDLVDFFIDFLVEKEFYSCVKKLKSFQEKLWNYEEPNEVKFLLNSKKLIEETSVAILCCSLKATSTSYQLLILLRHLEFSRLQSSFSKDVEVPDFRKMYRLSQCLENTSLNLNVSLFLNCREESEEYKQAVLKFVAKLQELQYFSEASHFAIICNVNSDEVYLNEWRVKAEKRKEEILMWKEGLSSLESANISETSLLQFCLNFVDEINSPITKLYLLVKMLSYTIDLMKKETLDIERTFWEIALKVEMTNKTPDYNTHWSDIWTILTRISRELEIEIEYKVDKESREVCQLKEIEIRCLDNILEKLFCAGCIEMAFRAANIFNYTSRDLDIVFTCHCLAKGILPDNLPHLLLSSSFPSYLNITKKSFKDLNHNDIQDLLIRLKDMSTIGEAANQRILLYYRISCYLRQPYAEIFKERDDISLLRNLFSTNSQQENLNLAKELISLSGISDECVADLISADVIKLIKNESESTLDENAATDNENNSILYAHLRLLNNPSILGRKLLQFLELGLKNELSPSILVEVCIKAHDCFTVSSDVEGIAIVLRNVKNLVMENLAQNNDYQSMIRLLKGINRYSEMTYIFDILKENDEFEMLLGKGIEKVPQLRIALLDSLKSDKEMYPLIALNFSMHREIAEMIHSNANKTIKSLQLRRQQNLMSSKNILERVLQDFVDASESYTKAGCYNKANACAKLAELIALQIHYLPSSIVIINLSDAAITEFVSKHPKFNEALIVAEGYQHHRSWDAALFNNFVLNGDQIYLREYLTHFQLTTTNFDEIVALYTKYKANNFQNINSDKQRAITANLRKLITLLDDVKKKYQYGCALEMHELANSLLQENGAFLRDLKQQNQL
ncbi:spatacsin-like protein [Dinothrombium tinctorium]|uniref:Spatacsin-like protein n=1 Tax=Dinothrombium tinctorium TaxID=1965070 RepID=A0A443QY09_9ACAR|nr:spatacsin-like protein [Dinothrombium tinctorium]